MVSTSENEIRLLDSNGALSETIPIDKPVAFAKFATNSDNIAIIAFKGEKSGSGSIAQVWDL